VEKDIEEMNADSEKEMGLHLQLGLAQISEAIRLGVEKIEEKARRRRGEGEEKGEEKA